MTDSEMIDGKGIDFTNSEGEECQVALFLREGNYIIKSTRSGRGVKFLLTREAAAALLRLLIDAELDPLNGLGPIPPARLQR